MVRISYGVSSEKSPLGKRHLVCDTGKITIRIPINPRSFIVGGKLLPRFAIEQILENQPGTNILDIILKDSLFIIDGVVHSIQKTNKGYIIDDYDLIFIDKMANQALRKFHDGKGNPLNATISKYKSKISDLDRHIHRTHIKYNDSMERIQNKIYALEDEKDILCLEKDRKVNIFTNNINKISYENKHICDVLVNHIFTEFINKEYIKLRKIECDYVRRINKLENIINKFQNDLERTKRSLKEKLDIINKERDIYIEIVDDLAIVEKGAK